MPHISAWVVGVGANCVIAGCYLTICWLILRGLLRTGQLRTNHLASATALIFLSCAVHHGGHAAHALMPLFISDRSGLESRGGFTWQMDTWDIFGAVVAIVYLSLRSSYGRLLATPAMFQDLERERIQTQIAAERARLAEAQAVAKLGSWSIDQVTGDIEASDEYLRLLGITGDAGDELRISRIHPEDRERVAASRMRLIESGQAMDERFRLLVPGQEEIVVDARGRAETDPLSGRARVTGTLQDVTDQVRAETGRRLAEQSFRIAFEQAGVPMVLIGLEPDSLGGIVDANAAFSEMLGVSLSALRGAPLRTWIHPDDHERTLDATLGRLSDGTANRLEFERRYIGAEGKIVSTVITDAVITNSEGERVVIEQALDISDRKRFEAELRHLADHDALTGLFNRRRFEEELRRALAHAQRYAAVGAVLAVDLDGFKFVNDMLGHAAGDSLVTRLAGTLRSSLRETDVVARTGGDEFAIVLPNADERDAQRVAEKLLSDIRRNGVILHGGRQAQVTGSIGIALYGRHEGLTGEDVMIEADIAMYDAKAAGKDRTAVYQPDGQRHTHIVARQDWLTRLRHAVDEERFVLWAQPIVPVTSHGVPRYELLLRMPDENGELIPPGAFLYNAERFGLIQQIDAWVLEQAVALLARCHEAGEDISLAVNMSAKTMDAGEVAVRLERLLSGVSIPDGRLVLEITETAAISNMELARELARDVRSLGAQVALDDFGAGFATLYYLKHLDFDFVKIDGEFIRHLPTNHADKLVVKSVVDIARGLGADTIAEFVQDDATLELLRRFGVGYAQGYHTGRPGPLETYLPSSVNLSSLG